MSSTRTSPSDVFRLWLPPLRKGTIQYEKFGRLLRDKLKQEGFTLQDIGTTEEELSSLRIKGATLAAEKLFDELSVTTDAAYILSLLRVELNVAGLTLTDISSSDEDIA